MFSFIEHRHEIEQHIIKCWKYLLYLAMKQNKWISVEYLWFLCLRVSTAQLCNIFYFMSLGILKSINEGDISCQ